MSSTPRVDILSRAVEINGIVQAEQLNIVTGSNKVAYSDLNAEKISGTGITPSVALDVSALGGMYANRITMVGTEAGVGVNSKGIMQATGTNSGITISVDGKVSLAQAADPNPPAGETPLMLGGIYSQGNINIKSAQLDNSADMIAGSDITLDSATIGNSGTISSGISYPDPESDLLPTKTANTTINITATDLTNSGQINSEQGNINLSISATLANSGVISADSLSISAKTLDNSGGIIEQTGSTDTAITTTDQILNTAGNIRTAGILNMSAVSLDNSSGYINGNSGLSLTAVNITNTDKGVITSLAADVGIKTKNISNTDGLIKAGTGLAVDSDSDLSISGNITAATDLHISATGNISQSADAIAKAGGQLKVTAGGNIVNSGSNIATGNITCQAVDATNTITGRISAQGTANINTTGSFVNHGKLSGINIAPITPTPDPTPDYTAPDIGQSSSSSAAGGFGGVVADVNANTNYKPIVEKTDSGIDIVQIASANNNGVSLNYYTQFNVANSGLILNNATEYSLTELAGYVDYNYRIGLRPAAVIVNQVTGNSTSNLLGYIEVAGHKASVVIANPNGIAVDNLGFINTNRATLVTGQANISGTLDSYSVGGGHINITGRGLEAIDTSRLELIAQDISISGGIWADDANLIAGHNTVHADTLAVTPSVSVADQANGIDLTADGHLTANNIKLTTTDIGSGIKNFGQLLTTSGDILINSQDKLAQHGQINAARDLSIISGHDAYLSGVTQAGGNLAIDTAGQLLHTGSIGVGSGLLSLSAGTDLIQTGSIRSEQGDLSLYSRGNLAQYGQISIKQGSSQITTGADSNQYGTIITSGDLSWQASGTARNTGDIQSQTGSIEIATDSELRQFGNIIAERNITIDSSLDSWNDKNIVAKSGNISMHSAQDLLNTGTINAADTLEISVANKMTQTTGTAIGGKQLTIDAIELTNDRGVIFSGAQIDLRVSDKLENLNSSMIYSQGDISIQGQDNNSTAMLLNQSSNIRADHDLSIRAGQLINEKRDFVFGWDVTESDHVIPLPGFVPSGDNYDAKRFYHRVVQDGAIYLDSPAAYLLAGNNLSIAADTVTNEYSFITAGQDMTITAGELSNLSYKNIKITTDTGRNVIYWKYNVHKRFHIGCYTRYGQTVYPYYNQTRVDIAGGADSVISAGNIMTTDISGTTTNKLIDAAGDPVTTGYKPTAQIPTSTAPTIDIPGISDLSRDNILIRPADVTSKYIYEMDPRFVGYKNFLSSDYLLNRILNDPTKVGKRIGDGYVEQELIRKQLLEQTGRQYTGDYTNMEETYKALMNSAAIFAEEFKLTPGIALTAEQMAKLTEDIVWFETREIDGQSVLVPVVYLAGTPAIELKENGALITGRVVNLNSGELNNSGNITAQGNLAVNANNINNKYGNIVAGQDLQLTAKQDINNLSGNISGTNVELVAGRDINLTTATNTVQYRELSQTTQDNTAQLTAKGDLTISSGRDINLQGALVTAEGKAQVDAGRDLNLSSVQTGSSVSTSGSGYSYSAATVSNQGSAIAGKDLDVKAAGDLNLAGSHLVADNNININVGQDINITNVKDSTLLDSSIGDRGGYKFNRNMNYDEQVKGSSISAGADINISNQGDTNIRSSNIISDKGTVDIATQGNVTLNADTEVHQRILEDQYTNVGVLSSKKTDIYSESYSKTHVAGSISGDKVNIGSGQDLNITASNVVAEQDVRLNAAGDVNISAAQDTYYDVYNKSEKTTGIFGGGGLGFTIGSKEQKDKYTSTAQAQTGSTIGSVQGNVDINSGKDVNIRASDVMSSKDINISGQSVNIVDANERYTNTESHEFKQTGLTVSLGGGVIDAVNKVVAPLQRAGEVSDERLKAVYAAKAAQELKGAGQAVEKAVNGDTDLSVSISFGTSQSSSVTHSQADVSKGSGLVAGGDVNITAREQDITIKGSNIQGENINLTAKDNVNIIAGENTINTDNKSDSKSASVGVNIGIGKNNAGVGVSLSGSIAKENSQEQIATYTPSTVNANKELNIKTGQDTNIIGSQVSGDKVTADIGGNLNIESLQETNRYQSDSKYAAGSVTIGNGAGIQGSAGIGNMDSNYASVNDQAGIYAGKEGFDITVGGNTDLKGAVIDSNATTDKNQLDTGTISFSDIENKAEYSAGNVGIGIDTRPVKDSKNPNSGGIDKKDAGVTPSISGTDGKADSTTKSAVAEGTIEIKDKDQQKQDVDDLSRDPKNANNKLDKIFDKDKILTQQELAKVFGEVAFTFVGEFNSKQGWTSDDPRSIAVHAVIGGIMAQLNGGSFA